MTNFPNDADGDVLRSLASKGVDLSKPRKIEFYCYAADYQTALKIVEEVSELGFTPDIFDDREGSDKSKRFSVYSAKTIIPSYDNIIEEQRVLNELLEKYQTECDGWGTMSNGTEKGSD